MMTTFDRYLVSRMLHTFGVFFVAAYGLYVVIDLFTNIDDFQHGTSSLPALFGGIARYYLFRTAEFFEMAGPVLIVIAVITVLALLQKNSETYPILAAGIPAFRLLKPLILAAAALNLLLILNQEVVIPLIAAELQAPRGSDTASQQEVEPGYDYSNDLMHIDARRVIVAQDTLVAPVFTLPTPQLTSQSCTLTSESAVFLAATERRPSGWLLRNLTGVFDPKVLTERGRRRVIPHANGRDLFVRSEFSCSQLYFRGRPLKMLSSWQLVQWIRNPATGPIPVRSQSVALHARITRPVLCLLSITMALPLVLRRESVSLIANMAVCAGVLGSFYAGTQASLALGNTGFLRPDLAAWLPVILSGWASSWTASCVQT